MYELSIIDSFLLEMNFNHQELMGYKDKIYLETNAQVSYNTKQKNNDNTNISLVKFIVSFNKNNNGNTKKLFNFTYGFKIEEKNINSNATKEIDLELEYKNLIMGELYPMVQKFLKEFYQLGNIEFIDLPEHDE